MNNDEPDLRDVTGIICVRYHPISTFDVGWQPEILSPIARLPAGLYCSILSPNLSPQNMRAFQRTGSRIFSNEKLPQSHSISSILLNLPF